MNTGGCPVEMNSWNEFYAQDSEESVMSVPYVTISKFSELSGYTEDAIRSKIRDGVWLLGFVWIKAPDGRILISTDGYRRWAEGESQA